MNLESVIQDLRLAWRGLGRSPAFAATAVAMLAIGMAAAVTMFALVQGVLLRPLPMHEPDRLILSWKEVRVSGSAQYPFGNTEIESVARASRLLVSAAGVTRNGVGRSVLADTGEPDYVNVGLVTGAFFDVLGAQPILGRTLRPEDDKEGSEHVVVLSSALWRRRYGASREVIGRRVRLDDQPHTIVGIMPPDLDYPAGVEVWKTTGSTGTDGPFGDAARREVNLIGRLHAGVTLEQVRSEISALAERQEAEGPGGAARGLRPVVRPFTDVLIGDVRGAMLALFAAVGLVLLIATANVANLLLMRGEARRSELAVRAALGAGRGRIVQQILAESFVLTALAGTTGFIIAWWSLQTLVTLVPDGLPRAESIRIDGAAAVFAVAMVFLATLLAGVVPAMMVVRRDLAAESRRGGRGMTGPGVAVGRRSLVVAQIVLTISVVAAAGLLVRSLLKLQSAELGLPAGRLVLLDLHMPQAKYAERARRAQFLDQVIAQLEGLPVVAGATPVNIPPFAGRGWDVPRFTAEGQGEQEAASNPSLNLESIHPNYFATVAVSLVRGRPFSPADREGAPEVAIVSEDMAARIWPGGNAVGKRIKMGRLDAGPWYTIVGVAAATRYREVTEPRPTIYLPAAQFQMTATLFVVRSSASLELLKSLAADRVQRVDREVQVMRVAPFTSMLDRRLARPRFTAFLLGVFGVSALLLSTVGLYAVMAAYVRQRDREIALRLALGATPQGVGRLVLVEVVRLAGLGSALGLAAATMTNRLLQGMLFEVDPLDPLAVAGAALLMLGGAAAASYLPVRRATRLDAVACLRAQ